MKGIVFVLTLIVASMSFAGDREFVDSPELRDSWAYGIGFGTGSSLESLIQFDLKSPRLFSGKNTNFSLVFNLEQKNVSSIEENFNTMHLLFEFASNPYKGIVKTYVRVGPGVILVDDARLHRDSSFFSMQVHFGVEVVASKFESGRYTAFFAQTTLNSPSNEDNEVLDVFDATTATLGFRTYF